MIRRRVPLIQLLKERYPARGEKELFAEILRGGVSVGGVKTMKPGALVAADAALDIRRRPPYVSRGGEKLACALDAWGIDCAGRTWVDAGSSTGGFTDCLLERGAVRVYAIDVGPRQLDQRLRLDPRVVPMEGTNVMDLRRSDLDPEPDRAVGDLSFRSLRRAAAHVIGLTREGWCIFLAKPQFEWMKPPGDFRGVVKEPAVLFSILMDLLDDLDREGVGAVKAIPSPLRGRRGNREFLLLLRAGATLHREALMDGLRKSILE